MNFHSLAFRHEQPHLFPTTPRSSTNYRALAALLPLAVGLTMALLPPPPELAQYSWWYLSLFVTVIVGLIVEPVPAAAVGLLGVTAAAVLSRFVLYSPDQLAVAGFNPNAAAISWALSGFANPTVWLIFSAFVFSLGYEKTGLGKRISLLVVTSGRAKPDAGLCHHAGRSGAGAVHAVEYRAQRRHDLPGDQEHSGILSVAAQRSLIAAHRQLFDVDGDRIDLHHQLDVPDRSCSQSPGGGAGAQDGAYRSELAAVVCRLPAGRVAAAADDTGAGLCALSARDQEMPRGAGMGAGRAAPTWPVVGQGDGADRSGVAGARSLDLRREFYRSDHGRAAGG